MESLLPGKGLGQAQAPVAVAEPGEMVRELALDAIQPNPYQTRQVMEDASLLELTESIKVSGVMQPITVRPVDGGFQLVAGQRRIMAAKRAGLKVIPAIARAMSNQQALEATIIENLQREDLAPMEQARAFERLGNEFGLTQEEIAARTGKERATVANHLRLLRMPELVQKLVESGDLSFGHAKALMMVPGQDLMTMFAKRIANEGMSVRQAEGYIKLTLMSPEKKPEKVERPVDPNVKAAEGELRRMLGCKVEIKDNRGKGKIVIRYKNLEDFDRIIEAFGSANESR